MQKIEDRDPHSLKVWGEILRTRLETGEPYIMYKDNVNKTNPEGYKKLNLDVTMTNICSEIVLYTDPLHSFICCLYLWIYGNKISIYFFLPANVTTTNFSILFFIIFHVLEVEFQNHDLEFVC
jgi:ribonucleotide reductase alpha subunit